MLHYERKKIYNLNIKEAFPIINGITEMQIPTVKCLFLGQVENASH